MAGGSRSRGKPRKQNLHSQADAAITKRMNRGIAEQTPEAFAAAQALLERARIEQIRELSTLKDLDGAVDTLEMRPAKSVGRYLDDLIEVRVKYEVLNGYRNRIEARRKYLLKKEPKPVAV